MDDFIAIYKGLRLPLLGLILAGIAFYVFRPKNKKRLEQAKYNMLDEQSPSGVNADESDRKKKV